MSLMLVLSVLVIAGAVGVVAWTILSQLDDRQVVRDALRQLDGYEVENGRDQQMLAPLKDRAVGPLVDGVTGLGRRFTPAGYVEKVRQKLIYAGKPDQAALDRFLAIRVVSIVCSALGSAMASDQFTCGKSSAKVVFGVSRKLFGAGPWPQITCCAPSAGTTPSIASWRSATPTSPSATSPMPTPSRSGA